MAYPLPLFDVSLFNALKIFLCQQQKPEKQIQKQVLPYT